MNATQTDVLTQTNGSRAEPADSTEPLDIYDACDQCAAPLDVNQRYCVVCGTRRKHVDDPAARFLSRATSLNRVSRSPARGGRRRRGRSFGVGTVVVLVAIPLAVAVGVLVGRAGNSTDSKLLAALKAQPPTVVNVGGGGASSAASGANQGGSSTSVSAALPALSGSFALGHGYTVELQAIPRPTAASVKAAERQARSKGATAIGLITQADFQITPRPLAGDAVIYSGQYTTRSAAGGALAKLKRRFPTAQVVAVAPSGSVAPGKVLAQTVYGSAHQATGFKPTASQLATGRQVANQTAKAINGNYVGSQKGLPDQVSIP
jgi:hypothetical protein